MKVLTLFFIWWNLSSITSFRLQNFPSVSVTNVRKSWNVVKPLERSIISLQTADKSVTNFLHNEKLEKNTPKQSENNNNDENSNSLFEFIRLIGKNIRLRILIAILKTKFFIMKLQHSLNVDPAKRRRAFLLLLCLPLLAAEAFGRYMKKAFLEISYYHFFQVLTIAPSRIQNLRVTPNAFYYQLDGIKPAITRLVKLPPSILSQLLEAKVNFYAPPPPTNWFALLPSILLLGSMWFTTRLMQGPRDSPIGKSRELLQLEESYGKLSFQDIAGQDTAKLEVSEICDMLKNPEKYQKVGARLPSGVLLVGPPGSGKTLLARITASEAKVPFYACSASEFVEIFVGRGPARMRQLFQVAAKNAPCLIFIDEIDSIGRSRRMNSWNSEQETTLNQLLTCMDGLETSNNGVIVMAATNRVEFLDSALLRAGRFDRVINCPLPDKMGRKAILEVHTRKVRLNPDVDLEKIAQFTPGMSGADLSTIVNEASIRTARRAGEDITSQDFMDALKQFYSARSINLTGLKEAATTSLDTIPNWWNNLLKGITNNNNNNGSANNKSNSENDDHDDQRSKAFTPN